jgi:SAM-dependent methyltransferase
MIEGHYEQLLAARYTWMMGGIENCLTAARRLLDMAGLDRNLSGQTVLDLGCGPGYHARVLTERGCRVVAVDVSRTCLDELRRECPSADLIPLHANLLDRKSYERFGPFQAILCLGDTLPHLPDQANVRELIEIAGDLLAPGGILVLEFREQTTEMKGKDAVFTTRADRDRIMQCVLHYEPTRVWVTDVVHEWTNGAWQTSKSTYPKLRLDAEQIVREAAAIGLRPHLSEIRTGRRILVLRADPSHQ